MDRIESAIAFGAVLAALLMIPVSAATGTAVLNASEHAAAHRGAVLTQVQAWTLEDTEVTVWLDNSGAVTLPPRPAGDSAAIGGADLLPDC